MKKFTKKASSGTWMGLWLDVCIYAKIHNWYIRIDLWPVLRNYAQSTCVHPIFIGVRVGLLLFSFFRIYTLGLLMLLCPHLLLACSFYPYAEDFIQGPLNKNEKELARSFISRSTNKMMSFHWIILSLAILVIASIPLSLE